MGIGVPLNRVEKTGLNVLKNVLTKADKRGPRLANAYTGRKLREGAIVGAGVGGVILANGGAENMFGKKTTRPTRPSQINSLPLLSETLAVRRGNAPIEEGQAPAMAADGVQPEKREDSLGTDGSMVFGMYNKRHGQK